MADVTGPISSLPGASFCTPEGTMCDDHPDRLATVRIQGETDSFGSEMHDFCDECAAKAREEPKYIGTCDWCKGAELVLHPRRDYEEGMSGRVYYCCQPCITADNKRLEDELRIYTLDEDDYEDDDYEYEDYGDDAEGVLADKSDESDSFHGMKGK